MSKTSIGVVMSYWKEDDPIQIIEAVNSILNQTRSPDSIILVQDGHVSEKINDALKNLLLHPKIEHEILPENKGRGIARHAGVLRCNCELIALMDADDISDCSRLEKQADYLNNNKDIDVLGGYIQEIDELNINNSYRIVPLTHLEIIKRGRFAQPFNHVTIMFRKKSYIMAGGYSFFRIMEDYDFFHRLYISSSKFANIPEVLVKVRVNGQICRRQGYKYFREELLLQLLMYKSRYIDISTLMRNLLLRFIFRSLPGRIQTYLTKRFLRKDTK